VDDVITTTFTYFLDESGMQVAINGITDFEQTVSYVLLFNPKISSIKFTDLRK